MKFLFTLFLVVAAVVAVEEGQIVLQKEIVSDHPGVFAKGYNFTVNLTAYNVGEGTAYDVNVADNWPEANFDLIDGELLGSWEEIAPGASESMEIILQPTFEGRMPGFRASIDYLRTPEDSEAVSGLSSSTGNITVYSAPAYEKFVASHKQEWAVFLVSSLSTIIVPFVIYSWIQVQYTGGVPNQPVKSRKD